MSSNNIMEPCDASQIVPLSIHLAVQDIWALAPYP